MKCKKYKEGDRVRLNPDNLYAMNKDLISDVSKLTSDGVLTIRLVEEDNPWEGQISYRCDGFYWRFPSDFLELVLEDFDPVESRFELLDL